MRHRRTLVLVVMCAGMFLVLLDVTIVNVVLPSVRADLGASVAGLQWVVVGYAVPLAALMLACGDLGDRAGHRRVVLAGLAVFAAGSLAAGLAANEAWLVGARLVQGVGAALLLPGTMAVITRAFPDARERARALGVWAAISSLALPAGILAGGALAEGPGWRWAFLVNLPVIAVVLPVAALVVVESRADHARRADVPGTALVTVTLAATTFALVQRSWSAGVAAVAAGAALVAVERGRDDPLLPSTLLGRPAFAAGNLVAAAMNLGTLGTLFVLTLDLQGIEGRSALQAGVAILPAFAALALVAPLGGRLAARVGPRVPMVAGLLVAAAGLGLLDGGPLEIACALWGAGLGLLTPAVVGACVGAAGPERAGLASAVNNTARQAGGALGVAAAGAVAGSPAAAGFAHGFHLVAASAAGLYVLAAGLTLVAIPADAPQAAAARRDERPACPRAAAARPDPARP
jgi:MFS transporter, DHA2 family, methylenomycin A resistance protein